MVMVKVFLMNHDEDDDSLEIRSIFLKMRVRLSEIHEKKEFGNLLESNNLLSLLLIDLNDQHLSMVIVVDYWKQKW